MEKVLLADQNANSDTALINVCEFKTFEAIMAITAKSDFAAKDQ